MEYSVVLVKPDGVQRALIGQIISRFERKGLKLIGLKMMFLTDEILDSWYVHHKEKPFFGNLKKFMESSPIVAMLWEGVECVNTVRKLVGVTKGREAECGSIRGDFAMSQSNNLIHASDSVESAQKERDLVFEPPEIFDYAKDDYVQVYSEDERK